MDIPLIVPGLVDVVPPEKIHVKFPQSEGAVQHVRVQTGGLVKPKQAILEPELSWKHDKHALYTLVGINPDASPTDREVLHWMVMNVPGDDVCKGDKVCAYTGGKPPPGTQRTYVFLAFRQNGKLDASKETIITEQSDHMLRKKFNTKDFCKKHGFGSPEAGTHVISKPDAFSDAYWAGLAAAKAK